MGQKIRGAKVEKKLRSISQSENGYDGVGRILLDGDGRIILHILLRGFLLGDTGEHRTLVKGVLIAQLEPVLLLFTGSTGVVVGSRGRQERELHIIRGVGEAGRVLVARASGVEPGEFTQTDAIEERDSLLAVRLGFLEELLVALLVFLLLVQGTH